MSRFKKLMLASACYMVLMPVIVQANGLQSGVYSLVDGQVPFELTITAKPNGKMFLVGNGSLPDGRGCRVGDLAELRGGQLMIGACSASIAVRDGGFQLSDAQNCFQCAAGLSASGIYKKQ